MCPKSKLVLNSRKKISINFSRREHFSLQNNPIKFRRIIYRREKEDDTNNLRARRKRKKTRIKQEYRTDQNPFITWRNAIK